MDYVFNKIKGFYPEFTIFNTKVEVLEHHSNRRLITCGENFAHPPSFI